MKITKITPQVKNKDRYNIYIDDKYSFSISMDEYIENTSLRVDKEIISKDVEKYKGKSSKELAYNFILYHISRGRQTEKQIRDKFKRKEKYSQEEIEYAINKAKQYHYIDDEEYCRDFIEMCICRKIGKQKMIQKLYNKGLKKDLFSPILEELLDNNVNTMYENAKDRCIAKYNQYINSKPIKTKDDYYKIKNKLFRYMMNQGFEMSIVKEIIENVMGDFEE